MKKALINLIDLKSIITLAVTIAIIIFTYKGIISNELFVTIAGSVFTFYFTKKKEVEDGNKKENNISEQERIEEQNK